MDDEAYALSFAAPRQRKPSEIDRIQDENRSNGHRTLALGEGIAESSADPALVLDGEHPGDDDDHIRTSSF